MVKETNNRRKLSPAQMDNLVRVSCEISEINSAIKNVHPENGYKKTVILRGGHDEVAITSHAGMAVRDEAGDPMATICDPQFFEMITDYFIDKKNLLLEEVCAIINAEGGEE